MAEVLVVSSKVKALVSAKEVRTGGEFIDALSKKVEALIDQAIANCLADGRKTLKPEDLTSTVTAKVAAAEAAKAE